MRALVLVLGDQLDPEAAAFDGFEPGRDAVWMAEVDSESTHVWSSKQRTALFLAAMRHFAVELRTLGRKVHYTRLDDPGNRGTLGEELRAALVSLKPQRMIVTEPGEARVLESLRAVSSALGVPLEMRDDRHFYASRGEFAAYAAGRTTLRLEYFYRDMRRKHRVLLEDDEPVGGRWNFDAENRGTFGTAGPSLVPSRAAFAPDEVTRAVIQLVNTRYHDHPGNLESFAWPVTRRDALSALRRFVDERLPLFGRFQDAMWSGEAWGYHAHLSAALNLKLLSPREVVRAAEAAYRNGQVPLASAEGFIRQILGWREYVRGIYWSRMPGYADSNALQASMPLPPWYWTGRTAMACLRNVIEQTLELGYAHHIQRLMVTGLYALLLGVRPREVHEWYLAVYVDAVEWVEMPNTLGMSLYADGGLMASKPYAATGNYIRRMSNYCAGCRFDPQDRDGDDACPFTTLYWDFLLRHDQRLAANQRMGLQLKNARRLSAAQRAAIARRAAAIRSGELDATIGGEPGAGFAPKREPS